ncbi:MAG TPA: hypothetical protein VMQ60_10425 [Acidobacteriaceae bacterium]|nr:hypothetical protein [Acidobacteriaceae bacterium]
MRPWIAVALMLAFISPLVLPLFAATSDSEASLPACCRSHGKHHCAMMHWMLMASSGPALTAPPCPLFPSTTPPVRIVTAFFSAPPLPSVELRRDPSPPAPTPLHAPNLAITSQSTRGPPSRLA